MVTASDAQITSKKRVDGVKLQKSYSGAWESTQLKKKTWLTD